MQCFKYKLAEGENMYYPVYGCNSDFGKKTEWDKFLSVSKWNIRIPAKSTKGRG
jgi:hypothetical protein